MKPNSNIQKQKHRIPKMGGPGSRERQPRGPQIRKSPPRLSLRGMLIAVLCALVAFGGTWAFFELVVWNTVPAELVGKWVVTEGQQEGATFDFFRGGTMVGTVNVGGNEATVNARIRVEDKKIFSITMNPNTGRDDTRVLTIRSLSATDLVIEDAESGVLKMVRAQ
jgi:uncharacterized protein (TIGR03066 family)